MISRAFQLKFFFCCFLDALEVRTVALASYKSGFDLNTVICNTSSQDPTRPNLTWQNSEDITNSENIFYPFICRQQKCKMYNFLKNKL